MRKLEEHLKTAQEHFIKCGTIMPVLIAEDTKGKSILMIFADFPSGTEKHRLMMGAGKKVREDKNFGELKKIVFVTEAWAKTFPKDADLSKIGSMILQIA